MSEAEPGKGMSFFDQAAKELPAITKEQQALVDQFAGAGMDEETDGLPIEYPRIKMIHGSASGFQFVTSGDEGPVTDSFLGVILFIDKGRAWWPEDQEGLGGMPKCYSRDLITMDPQSEQPQCDDGKCATCPKSQWKSAINKDGSQGKGKSCKEVRRLFLIPQDHLSPHWMAVPPTSLRALRRFTNVVRDKGFKRPQMCVTRFSCKVQKAGGGEKYSELALEVKGGTPAEWLPQVLAYHASIGEMIKTAAPMSAEEFGKEPGSDG